MVWKDLFIQSAFKFVSDGSSHNGLQNLSNSFRVKFVSFFLMCLGGGQYRSVRHFHHIPELTSGGRKTLTHFDQTDNFV